MSWHYEGLDKFPDVDKEVHQLKEVIYHEREKDSEKIYVLTFIRHLVSKVHKVESSHE